METITIEIKRDDVYAEVAKATDYTGSKLVDSDNDARDRILAADDDLIELSRFWDESALAVNENFKEMLVDGQSGRFMTQTPSAARDSAPAPGVSSERPTESMWYGYRCIMEVSKSFDTALSGSVESALRSYFIASIIGQWFKFANKGEAEDYFMQASELLKAAERLLYSRRKPTRPND